MNKEEFDKYCTERYSPAITWYDKKAGKYKSLYYWFQTILIVLSALTPVFTVLTLTVVATITGSIVAILASLIKFMKLEEHWRNYRTTCETLKKEQYLFNASLADYKNNKNNYSVFVNRVESLISRENTLWVALSAEKKACDE